MEPAAPATTDPPAARKPRRRCCTRRRDARPCRRVVTYGRDSARKVLRHRPARRIELPRSIRRRPRRPSGSTAHSRRGPLVEDHADMSRARCRSSRRTACPWRCDLEAHPFARPPSARARAASTNRRQIDARQRQPKRAATMRAGPPIRPMSRTPCPADRASRRASVACARQSKFVDRLSASGGIAIAAGSAVASPSRCARARLRHSAGDARSMS